MKYMYYDFQIRINPVTAFACSPLLSKFFLASYLSQLMTKPTKWQVRPANTGQPGHPPSLIGVFAVRSMGSCGPMCLHAGSDE